MSLYVAALITTSRISIADPAGSSQPILGLGSLGGVLWSSRARTESELALLDRAHDAGYTVVDTAPIYGLGASEKSLGHWISLRRNRERVVIISKGGHPRIWRPRRHRITVECLAEDLAGSLERLRTDYIDLYLLHRDAPECDLLAVMQFLHEQKSRGTVRAIGVSNWHHRRLAEANEIARRHGLTEFAVSSPQLSVLSWSRPPWSNCVSISGPEGAAARSWYRDARIPVFAWSPFGGGVREVPGTGWVPKGASYDNDANRRRLARAASVAREKGITVPQVLVAYLASLPFLVHPICASREAQHLRDNQAALHVKLSADEVLSIEAA